MIILYGPVYSPTAPMESLKVQSVKCQQQHPKAKQQQTLSLVIIKVFIVTGIIHI